MKIGLILLLVLMTTPVMAQGRYTPVPPDENTAAPNTPVVTWSRFCKNLATHIPSDDVTYQPNVDVHGRSVAPADLPRGEAFNLPTTYRMFITSDQANKLGLSIPGTPLANDMLIGEVLVDLDGHATFNGQPIQDEQIISMCGQRKRY